MWWDGGIGGDYDRALNDHGSKDTLEKDASTTPAADKEYYRAGIWPATRTLWPIYKMYHGIFNVHTHTPAHGTAGITSPLREGMVYSLMRHPGSSKLQRVPLS